MTDAQKWAGTAQAYADSYAQLCAGALPSLLTAVNAESGALVLDVGSGTGTAASALAAGGCRVLAVEPDPDLLAILRAAGLTSVRALLPQLPLPDRSVRHSVANFVINHLSDPRAGVRELVRVTHGRVAATIWPSHRRMSSQLVSEAFETVGVTIPPGERLPAGLDFPRTAQGLADLFADAGLEQVRADEVSWVWEVSPEVLWRGVQAGIGVQGRAYRASSSRRQADLTAAFGEAASRSGRLASGRLRLAETAVVAAGQAS